MRKKVLLENLKRISIELGAASLQLEELLESGVEWVKETDEILLELDDLIAQAEGGKE